MAVPLSSERPIHGGQTALCWRKMKVHFLAEDFPARRIRSLI